MSRTRIAEGVPGNPGLRDHLSTAVLGAFEDAGITGEQVERAWVGNFLGELFCRQGHLGSLLAGIAPGLDGKPIGRVEAACASGSMALTAAAEAIQAGWDVALVAGVELETHVRGRDGVDFLSVAADRASADAIEANTFPYLFAKRARAYKAESGAPAEATAAVVAKAYRNASDNPVAQMRAVSVTAEEAAAPGPRNRAFLEDPELRDHCRLLESTTFTDGASALVLVSERGLAKLGRSADGLAELVSWGHSTAPLAGGVTLSQMTTSAKAARTALADGGVTADDLDLVEVHDCFAITEILLPEALGLAPRGAGWRLALEGHSARDGRIPVNPGGGLLGIGHPVGATGVRQTVDLVQQLRGRSPCQVAGAELGLAANIGGDDRTAIATLWRSVS